MIDSEQLFAVLKDNGVAVKATLVFEANHLENAGPQFGASLAAGLQALVSRDGLLVVPTCTPAEGFPKPAFDPLLSSSEMGWFSEFFRGLPGVYRSNNPTHSTAAWGAAAEEFVAGHRFVTGRQTPWGESAFGRNSPWDRLYARNAWWVMVNPDWYSSPFTVFLFSRFWELQQGVTKITPFPDFYPLSFSQEIEKMGFATRAMWGAYPVLFFKLRDAIDLLLSELARHPGRFGPSEAFQDWLARRDQVKEKGFIMAGAWRTKITPSAPVARWDGKRLDGVFRDLYARVVVFADGARRSALVVCDLLGLTRDLVLQIRDKVHRQAGLPAEAILIACTHAHSTPDTIAAGFSDPAYLEFLVEAVAESICRAAGNLQPARMGWNRVAIRGLAHSRRQKMLDGRVYTTRYSVPSTWRVKPALIAGSGPIDPDLTVGRIERLNGEVLAVIANFGCHASVALASPNVSGDFPGESMAVLESVLGESSVALCTNGAAADVDPTLEMPYWGPRNDANAVRLGRIYAAQVLEALERVAVQDRVDMDSSQVLLDVPLREDWIRLVASDKERMLEEYAAGWQLAPTLVSVLEEKVAHTEVQALRLGDTTLVAFPGEVFVETSQKLKQQFAAQKLAVIELANDNIGYIPTRKAFDEGGYECGLHFGARIPPEGEARLYEAAGRAIETIILTDKGVDA